MGTLLWIMVVAQHIHKGPYKGEAGGLEFEGEGARAEAEVREEEDAVHL